MDDTATAPACDRRRGTSMTPDWMNWMFAHPLAMFLYTAVGFMALLTLFLSVRYIPNTRVGIVEKLISAKGSVASGLIALNGEAGFQPAVLRGGWHILT